MARYIIVNAQKEEQNALVKRLSSRHITEESINNISYLKYKNDNVEFIMFVSGIGKVNSAYQLTKILSVYPDIKCVFNLGVAGAVNNDLNVGDTLVATKVCYFDVDLTTFNHSRGQFSDLPLYFYSDEKIINKIEKMEIKSVKYGLIISGDTFITKDKITLDLLSEFDNPLACDMESAAVAHVCYLENIPFVIIRSISDKVFEDYNTKVYNSNLATSSSNASKILLKLLDL